MSELVRLWNISVPIRYLLHYFCGIDQMIILKNVMLIKDILIQLLLEQSTVCLYLHLLFT